MMEYFRISHRVTDIECPVYSGSAYEVIGDWPIFRRNAVVNHLPVLSSQMARLGYNPKRVMDWAFEIAFHLDSMSLDDIWCGFAREDAVNIMMTGGRDFFVPESRTKSLLAEHDHVNDGSTFFVSIKPDETCHVSSIENRMHSVESHLTNLKALLTPKPKLTLVR